MKTAPDNFQMHTHFKHYISTPFVLIQEMKVIRVAGFEGNIKIELNNQVRHKLQ
ncbi:hypothetical protein JQC92_05385 [Shewanella sp. 202IG2-18]|uniref:hypothetical protein n=1 Tax=Parashewanella hymeniacidonis TaxID=2807618 RepID=UPI0019612074|nr:hypothetical protein [Parashewanella hymeniacidonis]MBM7071470.1 hypothetical protein [Parashewanella hymeniacidonis]